MEALSDDDSIDSISGLDGIKSESAKSNVPDSDGKSESNVLEGVVSGKEIGPAILSSVSTKVTNLQVQSELHLLAADLYRRFDMLVSENSRLVQKDIESAATIAELSLQVEHTKRVGESLYDKNVKLQLQQDAYSVRMGELESKMSSLELNHNSVQSPVSYGASLDYQMMHQVQSIKVPLLDSLEKQKMKEFHRSYYIYKQKCEHIVGGCIVPLKPQAMIQQDHFSSLCNHYVRIGTFVEVSVRSSMNQLDDDKFFDHLFGFLFRNDFRTLRPELEKIVIAPGPATAVTLEDYRARFALELRFHSDSVKTMIQSRDITSIFSSGLKLSPELHSMVKSASGCSDWKDLCKYCEGKLSDVEAIVLNLSTKEASGAKLVSATKRNFDVSVVKNFVQDPSFVFGACWACGSTAHISRDCDYNCKRPNCVKRGIIHKGRDCEECKVYGLTVPSKSKLSLKSCLSMKSVSNHSRGCFSWPDRPVIAAIDSGASNCYVNDLSLVSNPQSYPIDDDRSGIMIGDGSSMIATNFGLLGTSSLKVDYVPSVSLNLLGVHPLCSDGNIALFEENGMNAIKVDNNVKCMIDELINYANENKLSVLTAQQSNGLYLTDLSDSICRDFRVPNDSKSAFSSINMHTSVSDE